MEKFMTNMTTPKRDILVKLKTVLDKLDIPFYLCSETCLGYARERDFIQNDNNISLGIHISDYSTKLIDALNDVGIKLYTFDNNNNKLIFLYEQTQINIVISDDKDELKEINFLGLPLNIPHPVENYLINLYGQNWRIPNDLKEFI